MAPFLWARRCHCFCCMILLTTRVCAGAFVMFKFIKLMVLLLVFVSVGYYMTQAQGGQNKVGVTDNKCSPKGNVTKNICYKRKVNGGILLLTAKEVVTRSKEELVLSGIKASYNKDGKNITIECEQCHLQTAQKKAYLQRNVRIKSDDTTCCTESAVVDFAENAIFGNSKITGVNARGSFVSTGFSIDKEGVIKLKEVNVKGKK